MALQPSFKSEGTAVNLVALPSEPAPPSAEPELRSADSLTQAPTTTFTSTNTAPHAAPSPAPTASSTRTLPASDGSNSLPAATKSTAKWRGPRVRWNDSERLVLLRVWNRDPIQRTKSFNDQVSISRQRTALALRNEHARLVRTGVTLAALEQKTRMQTSTPSRAQPVAQPSHAASDDPPPAPMIDRHLTSIHVHASPGGDDDHQHGHVDDGEKTEKQGGGLVEGGGNGDDGVVMKTENRSANADAEQIQDEDGCGPGREGNDLTEIENTGGDIDEEGDEDVEMADCGPVGSEASRESFVQSTRRTPDSPETES